MRLHPAAWFRPRASSRVDDLARAALAARVSLRDVVTVVDNHPATVGPLYALFTAAPTPLGLALQRDAQSKGPPVDDVDRGRRIAHALQAVASDNGWALDAPRALVDVTFAPAFAAALAGVVLPLMEAFGAHHTTPPSTSPPDAVRALRFVGVERVVRTPAPAPVDFAGLAGQITASSAKLRHLALLLQSGGSDALALRAGSSKSSPHAAHAEGEHEQWAAVADHLLALHRDGPAAFVTKHGEVGQRFVDELQRARGGPTPEPPNWDAMAMMVEALHRHGDGARALIDELVRSDALLPKSIPELEHVKEGTPRDAFAGVGIAGIQHLLPSLVPLVEAYIAHGARPADIWLLAKDYTNNPLVIAYLRTLGVHVMDATEDVDGTANVQMARARDVQMFARVAAPALASCDKELILDDGAALIEHMNAHGDIACNERRHAVELTTKGHRRLAELSLGIPVISIARTPNKIAEGEVIGRDLAEGLLRELRWQGGTEDAKRAGVVAVGLGTVGANFLAELDRRGFAVRGFDLDAEKRAAAATLVPAAQIAPTLDDALPGARHAVLITGTGPIDPVPFRMNAVQVSSGSSEAIELDENRFFEIGFFNAPLNGMRPLNFVRSGHETLSHREIGLTRATFFAASQQAVAQESAGMQELETTPALEEAAALWKREGRTIHRATPTAPAPPASHMGVHPTHTEWMRFFLEGAASEAAPVMVRPPPSATNFAPQPYLYFHDGAWNVVDTRDGRSRTLDLSPEWDASTQLLPLADDGPLAIARPVEGGSELVLLDEATGHATHAQRVGKPVALSTRGSREPPHARFTWIFESADSLQLLSGGAPRQLLRLDRVDRARSAYAVVGDDALLQVTGEPALYLHSLDGETVARLDNHGLTGVIGVSQPSNRPDDAASVFVVGAQSDGRVAVLRFDGAAAMGRAALPEGATYVRVDAFEGQVPRVLFQRGGELFSMDIPLA